MLVTLSNCGLAVMPLVTGRYPARVGASGIFAYAL